MTARRQASTTSLSKFERSSSPALRDGSLDFCNAFWGVGDGGVEVLFARMRGAARTVEELRNFWKERATIEEDYAKRLAKLSKAVLGRDEIGDLRAALDTVKVETERQASYHAGLAQQLRSEMEAQTTAFHHRQLSQKKTQQTNIEKEFKTKQAQEAHVNKAREKYEQDGMRINAYTAQSSLVQGKELDKIQSKLERANQTVQVNERDFANFAKILADTTQKWELSWKAFCDNCQDLEESRIEFMKDIVWNYANSVSTVCVQDDESCEKIRLALETMEPEREMNFFVLNYGTGNEIPDPPAFVNYNSPDAVPAGSARVTTRPANFARASVRELPRAASIEPPDPSPQINSAGIGAGGNRRSEIPLGTDPANLMRQETRRNSVPASHAPPPPLANGTSSHPQNITPLSPFPPTNPQRSAAPNISSGSRHEIGNNEPSDLTAETYIKVGERAYKVDPSKDPQQQPASAIRTASPMKQNGTIDPLEKQLQALQSVVSTTGSARRNTLHKPLNDGQQAPSASPSIAAPSRPSSNVPPTLSPPNNPMSQTNRSPSPNRDFRNSAEMVVGTHPSHSRPASPNPPTAAFMVPKPAVSPGSEVINDVLGNYQQSLPGERKSISRNNSRRSSVQPPGHVSSSSQASIHLQGPNNQVGQNLVRPPSVGHAGIGAHGSRSNSPQPPSRGPSPAPNAARQSFIAPPAQSVVRAPSPNSIGIALDPNGRVLHDDMAHGYNQHQQTLRQPQQQQRPPVQHSNFNAPQQQQAGQRRTSYMATPSPTIAPPPQHQMPSRTPPPAVAPLYQQHPPPGPQPNYAPPSAPHPTYTPPSQLLYQQQQQQPMSQPPPVQQPPQQYQAPPQQVPGPPYNAQGGNAPRVASTPGSGYYQPPPQQVQPLQQQPPPPQQQNYAPPPPQGYQQQQWNAAPAPISARRSPSPQPPHAQQGGPTTEDGAPIQFYVKALYDYAATIDEEFDFQAGDIIAVTSTPEDGWWTGELLDEARRQRGRNVFPSNFVCLF